MSAVFAAPRSDRRDLRLCVWVHDFSGAHLECRDRAIPGGVLCADHLIQYVHSPEWVQQ